VRAVLDVADERNREAAEYQRCDVISSEKIGERLRARGLAPSWVGEPPAEFTRIIVDSRSVASGDLFCAIRGTVADGHEFVDRAAAAGAAAALVEVPVAAGIPQAVVSDTRSAAAHLASLQYGDPGLSLRLAGVTGTNGKTTTVLVLRHLLQRLAPAVALGTLGMVDPSGERRPGRLTTPGPLELMDDLATAGSLGARLLAMEVSSHALVQRRVDALDFECAVFTNLTREHLDYHRDMEAYREAKLMLVDRVATDGTCVVNADDPVWRGADCGGRRVVHYGLSPDADVRAEAVEFSGTGSRWIISTPGETHEVRLPLLGEFNVLNALGAAAAALELGLDAGQVAHGLTDSPQVPGRMEILARRPGLVLRDYAHTPDALTRVLETVAPLVKGRLRVVFGCGGDRDRGKRPLMGRIAAAATDGSAILTADNPRSEDPRRIIEDIVGDLPPESYRVIVDRREAIAVALGEMVPGDAVLLAGKGHETYQEIRGERQPFDEKAIVLELLDEEGL
jgi:UDP-N-acetylmuramoyl-L-alanyl-D-glutamate--2,6-diaminopimelate ligase